MEVLSVWVLMWWSGCWLGLLGVLVGELVVFVGEVLYDE